MSYSYSHSHPDTSTLRQYADRKLRGNPLYQVAWHDDLRCESWGCTSNCRRLYTDFVGAPAALQHAEKFRRAGSGDPLEEARLMSLRASLFRDLGRFEVALRTADREGQIYQETGDLHLAREALPVFAVRNIHRETHAALDLLRQATA